MTQHSRAKKGRNTVPNALRFLLLTGIVLGTSAASQAVPTKAATGVTMDEVNGHTSVATEPMEDFTQTNQHSNFVSAANPQGNDGANYVFSTADIDDSGSTDTIHYLRMPTTMSAARWDDWLTFAKKAADDDYAASGREQKIIRVAAAAEQSADVFTIGNKAFPRVDVVDIASYQSGMTQRDFNALKAVGVKTIVVKVTEGTTYKNPYAAQQIRYARNAGLKVAVYHYSHYATPGDANREANFFAKVTRELGLGTGTTMVNDLEDASIKGTVGPNTTAFWQALRNNGFASHVLYTGKNYSWSDAAIATIGKARTWIAAYPYHPRADNLKNTDFGSWQFSSTALIPGTNARVDVSIDYTGIFGGVNYDQVTSTKPVLYGGVINQAKRSDGMYTDGPFNTSQSTSTGNNLAKSYDGQYFIATEEQTTVRGTYVKVKMPNGKSYWVDKGALKLDAFDRVLSNKKVSYDAYISNQDSRKDGIYKDGPYGTLPATLAYNSNGVKYNNQIVKVTEEKTTLRGTYVKVTHNGTAFWIDKGGVTALQFDKVTATKNVNYKAVVNQSTRADGAYVDGPYNTSASTAIGNANLKQYHGQQVTVTQLKTTARGTYAKVTLGNGKTIWTDEKALQKAQFDKVISTTNANYYAQIIQTKRADGVYASGPFNTTIDSLVGNSNGKKYNQQFVQVLKLTKTSRSTYAQVKNAAGETFWIDQGALQGNYRLDPIIAKKTVNYTGTITQTLRADGIYADGPYGTSLASLAGNTNGKQYNGQRVTVIAEASTWRGPSVQVKLANGKTFWIDKLALGGTQKTSYDSILSSRNVTYYSQINQASRADGVYAGGPFNTSAATASGNASGKQYHGQFVKVVQEDRTPRATYAKVTLVNGATFWIDSRALSGQLALDKIQRQTHLATPVNVTVNQANRADGMYASGPYFTSFETMAGNTLAKNYNGQRAVATDEAVTKHGTYVKIKTADGKVWWTDKRGLRY